jgi:hypothetical protein
LKITYEGQAYDLDMDEIDVKQGQKIEQHIGGDLTAWEDGMGRASVNCLQALGWLIFTGGDLNAPIADVNFKVMKLGKAVAAAQKAEADEPRPTGEGSPPPATST